MPSANPSARAVASCVAVLAAGQLAFVAFMVLHYGGTSLRGDLEDWRLAAKIGFAQGDDVGNAMFALHILFAVIITLGGLAQLVPQLRANAIAVHRWNGRVFMLAALVLALGGLYLTWQRGAVSTEVRKVSVSLNCLLLLWCALAAWRAARSKRIADHRRWALRAFLMAGGVWFFRVGLAAWYVVWLNDPPGSNAGFTGWFDVAWGFGNFLIPLAMVEAYFYVQRPVGERYRRHFAFALYGLTAYMALGITGTIIFVWWPLLVP